MKRYFVFLALLLLPSIVSAQVVFPNRGGTGTTTIPTVGQLLVGQANGTYGPQSAASLGLTGGGGGSSTISTSTNAIAGNLAYWTSASTLGTIATGTLTDNVTGLQFDATRGLIGGNAVLNLSNGFEIPTTASTSQWQAAWASTTALTPSYIRGIVSASPTFTGTSILANATATALTVTGRLFDNVNSAGLTGYVLRSTGTGFEWAATSTIKSDLALIKSDVGLGNVDNTSDLSKPVSTAQAAADNAVQAFAIDRANHTGTQPVSSISNFNANVRTTVLTGLSLVSTAVISTTDTILVALGSLQAQITALTTTVSGKQNTLVSGTNIKTINGNSLLGSGDLSISGGGGGSGITRSIVVTTGTTTASSTALTDYVYLVSGAHPVTLPTAVGNNNRYTFKNNHSGIITVSATSTETVDGVTNVVLIPEQSIDLISNGVNWNII